VPRARKLHDKYFNQAKREGYLARSAYKLLELDDRHQVLPKGGRVLDLGCAPGSWLQVAQERVGSKGLVVGIDLKPASSLVPDRVITVVGDFTEVPLEAMIGTGKKGVGIAGFDSVISDMAPNTTGHGDHFRSVRLCETILDRLPQLLRPGGTLVIKVLEGETFPDLLKRLRAEFNVVRGCKPKASRDLSRETFVVAKWYKASHMSPSPLSASTPPPPPTKPSPPPSAPPPPEPDSAPDPDSAPESL
jgi:23S rRNA (uridine2552-2'-O)-methyltransferase